MRSLRIDVSYPEMCLLPGRSYKETWNDPRTGSEVAWRRVVEELRLLGHDARSCLHDLWLAADVSISINDPRTLHNAGGLRICEFLLNELTFCNEEPFDDYTDLYFSPSEAHRQKAIGDWGAAKPEKWRTNPLGCDPANYGGGSKVPGRVVYCSSPDRGLHRLLEAWPFIKRAVPHASLWIFYRLEPWLRGFDTTPYFPPIEKLRNRALYVEEALKRLSDPKWGITVCDSVDRVTLAKELSAAECFAYPCETTSWSEGFSCSTLEACAAEACPIISDCDAFADVYSSLDPTPVGHWTEWRERVIRALTDAPFRDDMNKRARALAERLTWKRHVKQLNDEILSRLR